ncbi:sensor domain-containing diguanylate cyclase [Shewanella sp.]|uniref:sensor domain-containing diguanylate cyclase n=1 Tax=Shewanella sp. TaxID=50422 RepID=UPI0040543695
MKLKHGIKVSSRNIKLVPLLALLLLLNLLIVGISSAAEHRPTPLRITATSITKIDLTDWLYINTATQAEQLGQIRDSATDQWRKYKPTDLRYIGAKNVWLSFSIYNPTDNLSRIIALDNPLLDSVELFQLIDNRLQSVTHMGDSLPFYQRPLLSNIFLYPIELAPNELHTFYLKVNTKGSINLPLVLWSANDLAQETEAQGLTHGLQIGMLVAIGLFSLFIALASGSFSYSYYSIYVIALTLLVASVHGVAFRYLWPQFPSVQQYVIPLTIPIILAFSLLFTEKVLQLKYHSLSMLRCCRVLVSYSFVLCFLVPLIPYDVLLYLLVLSVFLISLILLAFSAIQAIRGQKNARLYTLARFGLLVGTILSGLIYLGLINLNIMPQTPVMIGLTFEVVVMASVLAIRYSEERKAKQKIQQEAIEQAERIRETREEALRAEAEANEKLEQMVQERTLELEITLRELNEVNQKLLEQTTLDSLTGVKNRNAFDKRLVAEGRISRRQQTPMAILMLDIDKFKAINDEFGHLGGDYCIQSIAKVLSEQLKRPTDLVSRFGGEEFAIILPNTDIEGAMLVAETVRAGIDELELKWDNKLMKISASLGVSAAIIESDDHPTELLELADKALYQAKRNGRNRVEQSAAETEIV